MVFSSRNLTWNADADIALQGSWDGDLPSPDRPEDHRYHGQNRRGAECSCGRAAHCPGNHDVTLYLADKVICGREGLHDELRVGPTYSGTAGLCLRAANS